MKIDKHFFNDLEGNIREWVAMSKIISDCDQFEVTNLAQSILLGLFIYDLEK